MRDGPQEGRAVVSAGCAILVTGAAGMLADAVVPLFARAGYRVIPTDIDLRNPTPWGANSANPSLLTTCAYNRLLRGLRWQGERGFAVVIGRWKRCATPPSALAGSVTSSPPHSTWPTLLNERRAELWLGQWTP